MNNLMRWTPNGDWMEVNQEVSRLFDSLLGATVQAIYYSPYRQKETEKVIDPNRQPNEFKRGWRWLNNDWVNFISSVVGAAVAAGLWRAFGS